MLLLARRGLTYSRLGSVLIGRKAMGGIAHKHGRSAGAMVKISRAPPRRIESEQPACYIRPTFHAGTMFCFKRLLST
jgi:hypothetical protein